MRIPTPFLVAVATLGLAPAAFAATLHGSIQVPPSHGRETAASEAREIERLTPLAKITRAQAIAAARRVATGRVKEAELDNENGSVVYSVTIGTHEVLVDAGNGKVLGVGRAD